MMNSVIDLHERSSDKEKSIFYQKTYLHVAGGILAFVALESVLLQMDWLVKAMLSVGNMGWLLVLGVFYVITMMGDRLAHGLDKSQQYIGLGLYVLAYSILFVPMLYMAMMYSSPNVIPQSALITLALFVGLTAIALLGNKDFSFLRSALMLGGFLSIGLIVAGMLFGFNLGLWFSVGMVVLAGGSILYQTSELRFRYGTDQYVAASVGLFASIMTLFWYILRIFMSRD